MGGGHLEAWGYPHTHAHTCAHMHMHTPHIYTCIEIANGHQHGGIHVYHVYNMFNMHVHVCMHGTAPTHPYPSPLPSTHLPPPMGVDPPESLKIQ